ncbi:MAG: serine/threonine-protein kinase [Verrucomicrobiaceae bacterium]
MSTPPTRPASDDLDLGETIRGLNSEMILFNRFRTKRVLGRGGMGVVWLAEDQAMKRDVALKFMPEIVSMDVTAVNDLRKETRNGLLLSHPNVVQMQDLVEEDTSAAIVMEYVDGTTLAQLRLQQPNHVFEVATLRPYLNQLLDALEYAHKEVKLFHRDLKPANLMVNTADQLKVADFGIASCVRDSVSRISMKANSAGTLVYASPQQLMGEVPKAADDIYSLGATLFELLTGKPPFYAGNIMQQVETKTPPRVTERRTEFGIEGDAVPKEWEDVIAACLEKELTDRPADVTAIRDGLAGKPFKRGSGETKKAMVRPTKRGEAMRLPLLPAWALGAMAVILVLGGALYWYQGIYLPAETQKANARLAAIAKAKTEAAAAELEAKKRRAADADLASYKMEIADAEVSESAQTNAKDKHALWVPLSIRLKEYKYPYGEDANDLRAQVETKLNEWAKKETEESDAYKKLVADKTKVIEGLRADSAKKDRGAGPILKGWESFVATWKDNEFIAAYGKDHEALIQEARDAVTTWTAKKEAESPKTAFADAEMLFADGPCAVWDKDEKFAALKMIQNVLKTSSNITKFTRTPDGKYDQSMHDAILAYQLSKEMPAHGKLDGITLTAMQVPTHERPKVAIARAQSPDGSSGRGSSGASAQSGGAEWTKWLPGNGLIPTPIGRGSPAAGPIPGIFDFPFLRR